MPLTVEQAFVAQAAYCRANDAPITAAIIEAAFAALDRESETGRRVLDWPGDPLADVVTLRLIGGLHAFARTGEEPFGALFAGGSVSGERLADAIRAHDATLSGWLNRPPQTNDVGRAAGLMAGLLWLVERHPLPVELWEIGSSAGLNLLLERFHLELGGRAVGPVDSPVRIAPEWSGSSPPDTLVRIASVRGVDRDPLDLSDLDEADRLMSYIWTDHTQRIERTQAAIALARADPPRLERGQAADWVEARLAEPPVPGRARVLMHSLVWQYLDADSQARITATLERAGEDATDDTPLGWVRLEADRTALRHDLTVRVWPGGQEVLLAHAHAHGFWVEWVAD